MAEENVNDKVTRSDESGERLSTDERRKRRRRKKQGDEDGAVEKATAPKETRTRSRQEAEEARERASQGRGENWPVLGGLVTYLYGVRAEVTKVAWPTRDEARQLTLVVIAVSAVFGILLGLVDLFYTEWFRVGVKSTASFLVTGAVFLIIFGGASWYYLFREES